MKGEGLSKLGLVILRCHPGRGFVLGVFAAKCKGFKENNLDLIAMSKRFRELCLFEYEWLCANVLRKVCSTFACIVGVCTGFKGNVQILSRCARVIKLAFLLLCARVSRNMFRSHCYVQGSQGKHVRLLLVLSLSARVLSDMFRS